MVEIFDGKRKSLLSLKSFGAEQSKCIELSLEVSEGSQCLICYLTPGYRR